MANFYYLVDTVGSGTTTIADPWRARESDRPDASQIKFLRMGQARADMRWIIAVDDPITHPNATLLATGRQDTVPRPVRTLLEATFGYGVGDLTETRFDELVFQLLVQPPSVGGWPELQPSVPGAFTRSARAPQYKVLLGREELISKPALSGRVSQFDFFDRANEDPLSGSSWSVLVESVDLVSTRLQTASTVSSGGAGYAFRLDLGVGSDHCSEGDIFYTAGSSNTPGCYVRIQSLADGSGYLGIAIEGNVCAIYESDSGFALTLLSFAGSSSSGDTLRMSASGSTLDLLVNGVSQTSTTDTTTTGGNPGVFLLSTTATNADCRIHNWFSTDGDIAYPKRRLMLGMGA